MNKTPLFTGKNKGYWGGVSRNIKARSWWVVLARSPADIVLPIGRLAIGGLDCQADYDRGTVDEGRVRCAWAID